MPKDKTRNDVKKTQRTTIDEARDEGIGEPEDGLEPTVPSYTDTGDVSDLGVDEPVVPRHLQGDSPADADEGEPGEQKDDAHGDTSASR